MKEPPRQPLYSAKHMIGTVNYDRYRIKDPKCRMYTLACIRDRLINADLTWDTNGLFSARMQNIITNEEMMTAAVNIGLKELDHI